MRFRVEYTTTVDDVTVTAAAEIQAAFEVLFEAVKQEVRKRQGADKPA